MGAGAGAACRPGPVPDEVAALVESEMFGCDPSLPGDARSLEAGQRCFDSQSPSETLRKSNLSSIQHISNVTKYGPLPQRLHQPTTPEASRASEI